MEYFARVCARVWWPCRWVAYGVFRVCVCACQVAMSLGSLWSISRVCVCACQVAMSLGSLWSISRVCVCACQVAMSLGSLHGYKACARQELLALAVASLAGCVFGYRPGPGLWLLSLLYLRLCV